MQQDNEASVLVAQAAAPSESPVRVAGEILLVLLSGAIVIFICMVGLAFAGERVAKIGVFLGGPAGILTSVLVATYFLRARGRGWRDVGMARRSFWPTFGLGFAVWFGTALLAGPFHLLVRHLTGEALNLAAFDAIRGNLPMLLLVLTVGWTSAAFGEEMVFRGYMLNRLAGVLKGGKGALVLAVLIQGALFGAAHAYQGVVGMLVTGFVGLCMGTAFLLTKRNLWVVIFAHGITDTVGLVAVFFSLDKLANSVK